MAVHEVVEVERLADDEAGAVEAVAGLELGVLALHHLESPLAKMAQQHPAVGRPSDAHKNVFQSKRSSIVTLHWMTELFLLGTIPNVETKVVRMVARVFTDSLKMATFWRNLSA